MSTPSPQRTTRHWIFDDRGGTVDPITTAVALSMLALILSAATLWQLHHPDPTNPSQPALDRPPASRPVAVARGNIRDTLTLPATLNVPTQAPTNGKATTGPLTVRADVPHDQLHRLLAPIRGARAAITSGPPPAACDDPELSTRTTPTGPITAISCTLAPTGRALPGMRADLTLNLGTATGVPLVPVDAVIGRGDVGLVALPATGPGARPTWRRIHLGLTDGTHVQATGLLLGQQVLSPAPADQAPAELLP